MTRPKLAARRSIKIESSKRAKISLLIGEVFAEQPILDGVEALQNDRAERASVAAPIKVRPG